MRKIRMGLVGSATFALLLGASVASAQSVEKPGTPEMKSMQGQPAQAQQAQPDRSQPAQGPQAKGEAMKGQATQAACPPGSQAANCPPGAQGQTGQAAAGGQAKTEMPASEHQKQVLKNVPDDAKSPDQAGHAAGTGAGGVTAPATPHQSNVVQGGAEKKSN